MRTSILMLLTWALIEPVQAQTESNASAPAPELPAPSPAAGPAANEITLEEWNANDWELLKPQGSLLELDGYLRLRGDLFRKLDFDNGAIWDGSARYTAESGGAGNARHANYSGANMRFRIEPQINVTDDIHLVTTLDLLDNLVMGSTPNSTPSSSSSPVDILSSGQNPPQRGVNALSDSLVVKRAYGRVTALNEQLELRLGRMPNHWGLGMMANAGDCLDCDWGDVVDRIALSFKAANHIFTPMFDWVASGPLHTPFRRSGGQPIDAVTWDDAEQYSVQVQRIDHPTLIQEELLRGGSVFNYGLWGIWRRQSRGLSPVFYLEDETDPNSAQTYDPSKPVTAAAYEERRDADLFTVDAFGRYHLGGLVLSVEAAFIYGTFKDRAVQESDAVLTDPNLPLRTTTVMKWGGALELTYRLPGDYNDASLGLKAGVASGDSAPGFGALDRADSQRGYFRSDAEQDLRLQNFAFSPEYHVDLLMYRRILGTVTDSWYVRPEVSYRFDDKFNGTVSGTYSQAIFKRSTASCYDPTETLCRAEDNPDASRIMGLELDGEVAYGLLNDPNGGALRAAFMGGILFPFGAFDNPEIAEAEDRGGSFAWTLQTRLYLTY